MAHTAQAREALGPDAFLGVEHAVLFESDPARARAAARVHLHRYLTTPYNIAKFRRLGYADEEITGGGSDRAGPESALTWGSAEAEPSTVVLITDCPKVGGAGRMREVANQRLWDTLYGLLSTGQRAVLDSTPC
ncbi:hypothetical protein [Microbispora bryophytorum]|uniref:hypothetical protein n=1 Tax=Microbispora bryophytorum TaxID=1460882 RepID=UPI0033CB565F